MEVAMSIPGTTIDCYEDMFKEITRKLYGEDGLPELNVGEKISTNISERATNTINDYEVDNHILKNDDHLTALGLAALMQNGFSSNNIVNNSFNQQQNKIEDVWSTSDEVLPWTQSKVATYNALQKTFRCTECDCGGNLSRIVEHWLGTHSNMRAFRCPQCTYESAWAKCVTMHLGRHHNLQMDEYKTSDIVLKNNNILQEITKYLYRLKTKVDANVMSKSNNAQEEYSSNVRQQNNDNTNLSSKRYNCTYCPYATDRRDLFTRHENIHREEKPFQCYVCQKQFNRADHVKKHFLRMHREHPYDLNKIRRHPPKNASGMSYYQKYNSSSVNSVQGSLSTPLSVPSSLQGINSDVLPTLPRIPTSKPPITNKNVFPARNSSKRKAEKRFSCCYCSWSGVDNWCLKRHMNTHLKPFICVLCDYKAARSERLTTHILKVHNKRACGKCSFLADEPSQLIAHQHEEHPLEHKNRSSNSTGLRINIFNGSVVNAALCSSQNISTKLSSNQAKNKTPFSRQHGAARLFSYMEASDSSAETEMDIRFNTMDKLNCSNRIQSDFLEAGDVSEKRTEADVEDTELPLFICPSCGCEFEDDTSLDTHQYTHRSTTSPAKCESKGNINTASNYKCHLCDTSFECQEYILNHMSQHSTFSLQTTIKSNNKNRSKCKIVKPKTFTLPFWDSTEIDILRHLNGRLRSWRNNPSSNNIKLTDKYLAQLITKRGSTCFLCPRNKISKYHTKSSAALHFIWRHTVRKFKCEHCDTKFHHKYQVILHGGRTHVKQIGFNYQGSPFQYTNSSPQGETTDFNGVGVSKLGEFGMTLFDHSLIQSTNSINHLHIIIPSFPHN